MSFFATFLVLHSAEITAILYCQRDAISRADMIISVSRDGTVCVVGKDQRTPTKQFSLHPKKVCLLGACDASVPCGAVGGLCINPRFHEQHRPRYPGGRGASRPSGGANRAAHNLGDYRGTGEIAPFCTCGSLMAKRTYAFGAHLGLSHEVWCLPSYFLHPKLRKIDAVLITLKLIALDPAAPAARSKHSLCASMAWADAVRLTV